MYGQISKYTENGHVAYQIEGNMDKNKMKSYLTGVALDNRVILGGGSRTWGRVVVESNVKSHK